jgi:putative addiction module component (TIGR02574 family)
LTYDQIYRTALALPDEARADLAERLMASFDKPNQSEIDRRWAEEVDDRIAAYDRGELAAIPGAKAFAGLRSRRGA